MSHDITQILDGWDYDPDRLSVRSIQGADGREKIQLRVDLGLLQLEVDGRPDGQRPEGSESWLDHFQKLQREHARSHPDEAPWMLESEDCNHLLREGIQYYHRYLSFWFLERYELCARDTTRNLRLFKFVREHARNERDKRQFDQWRPYVTMMHARAVATPLIKLGDHQAALGVVDAGIAAIRQFLEDYDAEKRAQECAELIRLEKWREQIAEQASTSDEPAPPPPDEAPDRLARLRAELQAAVGEERFEDAARIRDEIQRASSSGPASRRDEPR